MGSEAFFIKNSDFERIFEFKAAKIDYLDERFIFGIKDIQFRLYFIQTGAFFV